MFRKAGGLPETTRGKGERDQRGFQYITVQRKVELFPLPIAERAYQVNAEAGIANGAVPVERVIDTMRASAYT